MTDSVTFHFDPSCPWTWLTSRWLVDVAEQGKVEIVWQAFSLPLLYEGHETPEKLRDAMTMSRRATRVVQHLADAGRNDDVGRFYTAIGTALFAKDQKPSAEVVDDTIRQVGFDDADALVAVAADDGADQAVRVAHERAAELVGADVGSPVIITPGGNAIFGPIVSPVPRGEAAVAIWNAVTLLSNDERFFELKRGRSGGPDFG